MTLVQPPRRTSQWLSGLQSLTDWNTSQRTETFSRASLFYQRELSSHPLPFGVTHFCFGLACFGLEPKAFSSWGWRGLEDLWIDPVATEDFDPLVDETTFVEIGRDAHGDKLNVDTLHGEEIS